MKNKLKSILILTFIYFTTAQLYAQISYPIDKINATKESLFAKIANIDSQASLTEAVPVKTDSISPSEPIPEPNKTLIRTVYEGSKNLTETRTQKFAGTEEVVVIGKGNFKNILYTDILTNKVIKVKHVNTMEYMYGIGEDEKSNTERTEVNIYYENEHPFYAVFKEDHYKNQEELFFSNEYTLQITPYHKDMYFANNFQKTIYKYIQDLSSSILKQK